MRRVDHVKKSPGRVRWTVIVTALTTPLLVAVACAGDAGAEGPDGPIGPPGRPGLTGDIGLQRKCVI